METLLTIKFTTSLMRAVLLGMLANVLLFSLACAQTTEPVIVTVRDKSPAWCAIFEGWNNCLWGNLIAH